MIDTTRFTFGERRGVRLSDAERQVRTEVAQKHGATFHVIDVPAPRYWFSAKTQGPPFDLDTIKAVLGEIE